MDSDVEEDLPYVVWYQCRMCTHLFVDNVEKMFHHMENKHGDMIDTDELRENVYKNGLAMGGLSRPPPKHINGDVNDLNETKHQPHAMFPNSQDETGLFDNINGDKIGTIKTFEENSESPEPTVTISSNGNFGNTYEDSMYNSTNEDDENLSENYPHDIANMHDDDENLEDFGMDMKVDTSEQYDNDDDETDTQITVLAEPSSIDDDDYDYEDGEINYLVDEDGEITPEHDLDDQVYDEDNFQDGEDGPVNGNQTNGMLNYGFSCRFCDKFFTTRRGCESHEQHHKNISQMQAKRSTEAKMYPCRICKAKKFSSFKDLKIHIKSHTTDRIHICKFCYSTFTNTASLTKHLAIHQRENPNKCFCGKTFVSANTLKIHKKIHTGIKPFVCNFYQCGRAFVTKSTLESHLRTHTGEKPYQCSYCPSSFTTSSAKYRHERHVHKAPESAPI